MDTAIRLVRCPKCRKILAELPNIQVHTCGGCGTILEANEHKNDVKGNVLRAQETDSIQKYEPTHMNTTSRLVRCPKCQKILADLPNIHAHTCTGCGAILQANDEHKNDTKGNGLRAQEIDPIHNGEPSDMNTTIRLVRCSKCRKILAELPNIHVHTCTGCGAILQADKHENGMKGNGLRAQETDPIQKYEPSFVIRNLGNKIGQYSHDTEDFHSELALEERHSNEPQSFDNNSRSHLEKSLGPEKREEITAPRGPLIRSMVFAPLSTDEIYVKGSPRFHHISSDEMLDTLPINARVPIAPLSPDDIYMEESHEVGPCLHYISSDEMLDNLPINPRVPVGSMTKSPTKTYYGGDERESSYDGTELSAQVSHIYAQKSNGAGTKSTKIFRQKDRFMVKNKQNGEFPFLNERQDRRRHESPEYRKQYRPTRTLVIAAHNEPVSSVSSTGSSSELLNRNEIPESSTYNVWLHNGEFRRPDTMLGPFRDAGEEIRTGGYYDDPATGRNPYVDPKYYGHHRSHPQGVGPANQPRSSILTFSGDASRCIKHIDCRCSHCYHQDLHFWPKLSSHCIHFQHEAQPRHDYVNMYPSYSLSPQHYSTLEFSDEIQADKQKLEHEMKLVYLGEKHQAMKRHLRPVSGGAPIINCYHCSELLQLSADFLFFRRRCHRIRCNSSFVFSSKP